MSIFILWSVRVSRSHPRRLASPQCLRCQGHLEDLEDPEARQAAALLSTCSPGEQVRWECLSLTHTRLDLAAYSSNVAEGGLFPKYSGVFASYQAQGADMWMFWTQEVPLNQAGWHRLPQTSLLLWPRCPCLQICLCLVQVCVVSKNLKKWWVHLFIWLIYYATVEFV